MEKFKAALTAGKPDALMVQGLLEKSGYHLGRSDENWSVACVARLRKFASANPDALRRVFPMVADVCGGEPIPEMLLKGAIYCDVNARSDGDRVTSPAWRARFLEVGLDALMSAITNATQAHDSRYDRACAHGVLNAMNRGKRRGGLLVLRNGMGSRE